MNPTARAMLARYQKVQVTTCSNERLLVMLFDGLVRFVEEAAAALDEGDRPRLGERVGKALAILEHLTGTLNRTEAPELCERLEGTYLFAMSRLTEANVRKERRALEDVLRILVPLRDAWRVAVEQVEASRSG
ncbi:MAG: flagellar export chaperone FliS [Polyangiaceae bacterium]